MNRKEWLIMGIYVTVIVLFIVLLFCMSKEFYPLTFRGG